MIPRPWRTLRGRLAGAMVLVLLLAVGVSAGLDEAGRRLSAVLGGFPLLSALTREPYQDGLVLALFGFAALALIWTVSSWSLRPLIRASEEARLAGPRDPGRRLSRRGMPAELAPLVDAVNGALDRMAGAVATQRRFTEDAAHELRTPLAVLRLRLQRVRQAQECAAAAPTDWAAVERDLAQIERLVSQLLDLARKEGDAEGARRPLDLARVAREAAASMLPLAEAQGRAVDVDLPDALPVTGRAGDLRDALCCVLENALAHGRGTVLLRASRRGGNAVVVVGDEGPGVWGEGAPGVAAFDRFRKGAASTGSGLGLAITREVMRRHGGEAYFLPGPRCRIELVLPST